MSKVICTDCKLGPTESDGATCPRCGGQFVKATRLQAIQAETHNWRMSKWPELTYWQQFGGFVGELAEFIEILFKSEFYDEEWNDCQALKEEAGDVIIYFLGVLSLLDLDVMDCIIAARQKNKERDWEEHQNVD